MKEILNIKGFLLLLAFMACGPLYLSTAIKESPKVGETIEGTPLFELTSSLKNIQIVLFKDDTPLLKEEGTLHLLDSSQKIISSFSLSSLGQVDPQCPQVLANAENLHHSFFICERNISLQDISLIELHLKKEKKEITVGDIFETRGEFYYTELRF